MNQKPTETTHQHPDTLQHAKFEGCDIVALAPEDYESLYNDFKRAETELAEEKAEMTEYQKLFVQFDGGAMGLALHLSANDQLRTDNAELKRQVETLKETWITGNKFFADLVRERDALKAMCAEFRKELGQVEESRLEMHRKIEEAGKDVAITNWLEQCSAGEWEEINDKRLCAVLGKFRGIVSELMAKDAAITATKEGQ